MMKSRESSKPFAHSSALVTAVSVVCLCLGGATESVAQSSYGSSRGGSSGYHGGGGGGGGGGNGAAIGAAIGLGLAVGSAIVREQQIQQEEESRARHNKNNRSVKATADDDSKKSKRRDTKSEKSKTEQAKQSKPDDKPKPDKSTAPPSSYSSSYGSSYGSSLKTPRVKWRVPLTAVIIASLSEPVFAICQQSNCWRDEATGIVLCPAHVSSDGHLENDEAACPQEKQACGPGDYAWRDASGRITCSPEFAAGISTDPEICLKDEILNAKTKKEKEDHEKQLTEFRDCMLNPDRQGVLNTKVHALQPPSTDTCKRSYDDLWKNLNERLAVSKPASLIRHELNNYDGVSKSDCYISNGYRDNIVQQAGRCMKSAVKNQEIKDVVAQRCFTTQPTLWTGNRQNNAPPPESFNDTMTPKSLR